MPSSNSFNARSVLATRAGSVTIVQLSALAKAGLGALDRLPFSVKILLENLLRNVDGFSVTEAHVRQLAGWSPTTPETVELPFKPARVILQDFTGVPCLVDLAALRSAMARAGGDPLKINPLVPCDLVIDHSVQVDAYGSAGALATNIQREFERNQERYEFLKWGAKAFRNVRVVPPGTGIVHQVNLEYLASVVMTQSVGGQTVACPDTVVGTDSHTTMINGLGVLGWGVGGIEAEAAMLGQPVPLVMPEVVGFKLTGRLSEGATATDLVLTVTQILRAKGVVGKFVEFFGDGLASMSLPDRATVANMAPEYGATVGFFPVDDETLAYLKFTGRPPELVDLVERYTKAQGLFRTPGTPDPQFSETVALDLGTVEPSLAGPKRPQDRVALGAVKSTFAQALGSMQAAKPVMNHATAVAVADDESEGFSVAARPVPVKLPNGEAHLTHGSVVIAAITSCTNTSNPSVMLGAGLLAKKAVARGLTVKPYVKTSLAPGSGVVTAYLQRAGLTPALEQLGFHTVGYGCTTCLAAGTPVLLANGTARRIEQMPSGGGAVVFGPTVTGRLTMALQTEAMIQGVRDCLTLVLQDGRTLVCTPDHKILCAGGRWMRADELVPGQDRVVVGLEAPLDEPSNDETGYCLRAGDLIFSMDTPQARLRTLAFARLLGHLLEDGSISALGQGRINVGQAIDREVVLNDIEVVTGKRPKAARYDERKWTIVLPAELTRAIRALPGVRIGRRIDQSPRLPACVLDDHCPVAVLREFLGGTFGADGMAPILKRMSEREEDATLQHPAYSQSARPEHVGALKEVMGQIIRLLRRCDVKTEGAKIYEYPVRRSLSSYPAARDGDPRVEVRLQLPDGLSFVERVGFRYCVDKQMRASAAAVYWRTVGRIGLQRLWMSEHLEEAHQRQPELTFHEARTEVAAVLQERETIIFPHYSLLEGHDRFSRLPKPEHHRFKPLHRDACDFPSPVEFLTQLGVRDWFAPLRARGEGDQRKRYCVEKTSETLPTFTLGVLERRPAGQHSVYDITVDGLHAFVAGTGAVSNCIGNSGPLPDPVAAAIQQHQLVVAAVLSGNRNFEGRIHPQVRANYLASPPLVVAYAIAGTVNIDLTREPLGQDAEGRPVYLREIWPSPQEVAEAIRQAVTPEMYRERYAHVLDGDAAWQAISAGTSTLYPWDPASTYIQEPPFFHDLPKTPPPIAPIRGGRVLVMVGDSVTTDHISPAGSISKESPAGQYLIAQSVDPTAFNSYGARRGNDRVMTRGTFANVRLKNELAPGTEGWWTTYLPTGGKLSIYEAAERYRQEETPLVVLAGKEYGTGSSRDWAAKGTALLGVRAVLAESYERIHRSNLIGMGVLPLEFLPGQSRASLGLTGHEIFEIPLGDQLTPGQTLDVTATALDKKKRTLTCRVRIDTPLELEYYRHGGVLQTVLRKLLATGSR